MADVELVIEKLDCNNHCIMVNKDGFYATVGDTIEFTNDLTPPKDATITFYEINAKADAASISPTEVPVPVSAFCASGGDSITVPKKTGATPGTFDCIVADSMGGRPFQYSVAAGNYSTLDPVIIVEPGSGLMSGPISAGLFAAALVAALTVGFFSYQYGHKKGAESGSQN